MPAKLRSFSSARISSRMVRGLTFIPQKGVFRPNTISSARVRKLASLERSRSEEHTSELQSHSFISYAVFCLKKNIIPHLFANAHVSHNVVRPRARSHDV